MADARQFAKLDLGYFDNPKVADFVEDHPHVPLLHLRAILYCRQHLTNGKFPVRLVARMASASYCGSQCDAECDYCRAVEVGLLVRVDAKTGEVHDYLEHQQSAEDVARLSNAGKKGAAARWGSGSDADRNANRTPKGNPKANAERGEERREDRAPRDKRGTRIPTNFAITDEMREWVDEKGYAHLDLDAITEEFVDYWTGVAGAKGVKLDWVGTWRNWIRRKADDAKVRPMRSVSSVDHAAQLWANTPTVDEIVARRGF